MNAGRDVPSAMRTRVDAYDWSSTPLGARPHWPPELEVAVQQMLDSGFPKALAWGPQLITIYNDAFRPILGDKPEALGRPFSEVWAEVWDEIGPIADAAMAGKTTYLENMPLVIQRGDMPEKAWFTFCYNPLRLHDGSVGGMLDTVIETTETVRAQADLKLANEELAHRLKNSLAIVQAIAGQTLRHRTEAEALKSFQHRLQALAHAHSVLLRQNWAKGSFHDTILGSLEPNADLNRVSIEGPDFPIGSRATMALSMMLHELASNAAKYGAMSAETGKIALRWVVEADMLYLEWQEADGPPVVEPERTGFGKRLVEKGLGSTSKGVMHFEPHGLRFEMTVPLINLAD